MQTSLLTDLQRRALALADEERWQIVVEAGDGSQTTLRRGHPARRLVITLSGDPDPDEAALMPRAA